jgi:hypothetical protein
MAEAVASRDKKLSVVGFSGKRLNDVSRYDLHHRQHHQRFQHIRALGDSRFLLRSGWALLPFWDL